MRWLRGRRESDGVTSSQILSSGKGRVLALEHIGRCLAVENQEAISKIHCLARFQRDLEWRFLAFTERLLSDGIRGEEAVAACVPTRRESEVVRKIEHRERHGFRP